MLLVLVAVVVVGHGERWCRLVWWTGDAIGDCGWTTVCEWVGGVASSGGSTMRAYTFDPGVVVVVCEMERMKRIF